MKNALTTTTAAQGAEFTQENYNTKRPGLRQAINAMCRHCIYDQHSGSGTWRQQTAACTSKTCPLFPVRPMPTDNRGSDLIVRVNPENGHFAATVDCLEVLP